MATGAPELSNQTLVRLLLPLALLAAAGCGPRTPAGVTLRNVAYGTAAGQPLLLDVYQPRTSGPHPAVISIHGGAWRAGDRTMDAAWGQRLAAAGFVCFAVDYRLAPQYTYPAQVQDCARAVRWVRAHAGQYEVLPERIGAIGFSAGAHLALMLGVMQPDEFADPEDPNRARSGKVQCVVDFYGPADFCDEAQWPVITLRYARDFFGASPTTVPEVCAAASPVTHVTPDDGPVLMVHGDRDPVVPLQQSELLKAALDRAGVANQLLTVPHAGHNLTGIRPAQKATVNAEALQWLCQHLSP